MKRRKELVPVAPNVSGGPGVRVAAFGQDVALSSRGGFAKFRGAWYCSLSGTDELRIGPGYVNGLEPFLDGRLLSGLDEKGAADPRGVPLLKLKTDEYDSTGRSWICVRVLVNANGRIAAEPGPLDISIVQVKSLLSGDQFTGLFAIAVLRKDANLAGAEFGRLRQIAYFDLQHAVRKAADRADSAGEVIPGKRQHFFFPA